ncbi:MAG TPA: DNA polymerase III subunit delta [Streptosporangiaceae bacterium]|jgi:DNA polymerase-3 subunit delta|nr:DNA polymerase III subunit delta [Streptosporangiaceae bacterium]
MPSPASHAPSTPAPVNVVIGEEELLVERAVSGLVASAGPQDNVHHVRAAGLAPGELASLTAPSLFGGGCVVVVQGIQDAAKAIADELTRITADPPPDVVLVLTHSGGAKAKALIGALRGHGAHVSEYPKVTRLADRMQFIRAEFRAAGRAIDDSGVRALLDALGNDLREIASACAQLAADTTGPVDQRVVARYYRGRAEASGFTIADRAVEGRLAEALELLRWALAVGVSPVLITSGLAQGIRLLGRVGSTSRGQPDAAVAAEVGAPPWKVDRVRQQLRGWTPEGVASAIGVVAEADAQVKGEGANPGYALEVAIREITASREAATGKGRR